MSPPSVPSGLADWLILLWMLVESYRNSRHNQLVAEGKIQGDRRRYWPWILAGVAATLLAWGPFLLPYIGVGAPATIVGTADVLPGSDHITIPVSASLPYTVHYKMDWTTRGDNIVRKESGRFILGFTYGPPPGGGSVDWEVIPRAGSHAVEMSELAEATATPTPQPESLAQQWVRGSAPWQKCVSLVRINQIPPPHEIDIIATESSHDFAVKAVSCFQSAGNWTIRSHGEPDALVGNPSEYSLEDGITIRAHANSVDAETLHLIFMAAGFDVHQVILPDSDTRAAYPTLEIGNLPQ
jgi:hypothetical protein